ncbi:hypothetical protein MIR68_001853 [Amoeboaphelidium protococcarum]|nr:hypothetical protein MIR68_001853 [Amoeboaphelidium protococcarum]
MQTISRVINRVKQLLPYNTRLADNRLAPPKYDHNVFAKGGMNVELNKIIDQENLFAQQVLSKRDILQWRDGYLKKLSHIRQQCAGIYDSFYDNTHKQMVDDRTYCIRDLVYGFHMADKAEEFTKLYDIQQLKELFNGTEQLERIDFNGGRMLAILSRRGRSEQLILRVIDLMDYQFYCRKFEGVHDFMILDDSRILFSLVNSQLHINRVDCYYLDRKQGSVLSSTSDATCNLQIAPCQSGKYFTLSLNGILKNQVTLYDAVSLRALWTSPSDFVWFCNHFEVDGGSDGVGARFVHLTNSRVLNQSEESQQLQLFVQWCVNGPFQQFLFSNEKFIISDIEPAGKSRLLVHGKVDGVQVIKALNLQNMLIKDVDMSPEMQHELLDIETKVQAEDQIDLLTRSANSIELQRLNPITSESQIVAYVQLVGDSDLQSSRFEIGGSFKYPQTPVTLLYSKKIYKDPCSIEKLPNNSKVLFLNYNTYGIDTQLSFKDPALIPLVLNGWIIASVHTVGGDFKGLQWHQLGVQSGKIVALKQLIQAVKHFKDRGAFIAGLSASAGSCLMAASMIKDLKLWDALVLHSPFLDVSGASSLKDNTPLSQFESTEWGTDLAHFYQYCPTQLLDNMSKIDESCPHLLITAGMQDQRVNYLQSLRFVSRLRSRLPPSLQQKALIKIMKNGGHFDQTSLASDDNVSQWMAFLEYAQTQQTKQN